MRGSRPSVETLPCPCAKYLALILHGGVLRGAVGDRHAAYLGKVSYFMIFFAPNYHVGFMSYEYQFDWWAVFLFSLRFVYGTGLFVFRLTAARGFVLSQVPSASGVRVWNGGRLPGRQSYGSARVAN